VAGIDDVNLYPVIHTWSYKPDMYATRVTKWSDQVTDQSSRMRESCTSGSVREAVSDRHLYSTNLRAKSPIVFGPMFEALPFSGDSDGRSGSICTARRSDSVLVVK
jgi:hypothetical protein